MIVSSVTCIFAFYLHLFPLSFLFLSTLAGLSVLTASKHVECSCSDKMLINLQNGGRKDVG